MKPLERFDPFQDRLCRDVRNDLSESLPRSIKAQDLSPSLQVADRYLNTLSSQVVVDYIHDRIARYRAVLRPVKDGRLSVDDVFDIAVALWDQHLFFEFHEWLEAAWTRSRDAQKKLLQALIRAAGVYVHFENGNRTAARKLAAKALDGLRRYGDVAPACMAIERLKAKLAKLDPAPPKIGIHERDPKNRRPF